MKSHDEWPVAQTWPASSLPWHHSRSHLSCKLRLTKVVNKVKSRNNLLTKLACSSWGANANTLRSSALALCYSVAMYCCPVWARSAHTYLVDVQLNSTITLSLEPCTLHHYPGYQFWQTSSLQLLDAKPAVDRLIVKTALHEDWPLHKYMFSPSCNCMPSRRPLWTGTHPIDVTKMTGSPPWWSTLPLWMTPWSATMILVKNKPFSD